MKKKSQYTDDTTALDFRWPTILVIEIRILYLFEAFGSMPGLKDNYDINGSPLDRLIQKLEHHAIF